MMSTFEIEAEAYVPEPERLNHGRRYCLASLTGSSYGGDVICWGCGRPFSVPLGGFLPRHWRPAEDVGRIEADKPGSRDREES